jgi:hypothetical protein
VGGTVRVSTGFSGENQSFRAFACAGHMWLDVHPRLASRGTAPRQARGFRPTREPPEGAENSPALGPPLSDPTVYAPITMKAYPEIDYGPRLALHRERKAPADAIPGRVAGLRRPDSPICAQLRALHEHTPDEWVAEGVGGTFELLVEKEFGLLLSPPRSPAEN